MELSLFDLHCDTAFEMLMQDQRLSQNTLAVSLDKARKYDRYVQVMALWTPASLDDEAGWHHVNAMIRMLGSDPALVQKEAFLCSRCPPEDNTVPAFLLSLEDARILCGSTDRLEELLACGVRIVTPMWKGLSPLGGAHDTNVGLTDLGKRLLRHAVSIGMTLDVSHASVRAAEDMLEIGEEFTRPIVATHSNAKGICPVSRNLSDGQIKRIVQSDGIIGINLYPQFLRQEDDADVTDVLRHVEYMCALGAEHALALGCDMDGAPMPSGLDTVAALPHLAEALLAHNYTETQVRAIFFENAYRFASTYFD